MELVKVLDNIKYNLINGSIDVDITDISFNSKTVSKNNIFVAINGYDFDGHEYIDEAIKNGANVIVVSDKVEVDCDVTVICVENTRKVLATLSSNFFGNPATKLVKIGITGTKGKTSTSFMIKEILSKANKKVGLIGTNGIYIGNKKYDNPNTTPSSYHIFKYLKEMIDLGYEYVVMEVSSHALKSYRVDNILFDYAIFTNLSIDHVGPKSHPTYDDYVYSKSLLFQRCKVGILNLDDKEYHKMINDTNCLKYTYGKDVSSDIRITKIKHINNKEKMGMQFSLQGLINDTFEVNIPGEFSIYNASSAIIIGYLLHIDYSVIKEVLKNFNVRGRGEMINTYGGSKIIIDYAHNKLSVESIIDTVKQFGHNRIITIIGCSGNRSYERRIELGEAAAKDSDLVIITSDNPDFTNIDLINKDIIYGIEKVKGKYIIINDRKEALYYAIDHFKNNDIILTLGKGHEEYQLIEGIKHYFNEREIILDYLKNN